MSLRITPLLSASSFPSSASLPIEQQRIRFRLNELMANKNSKVPENIPGVYYVDSSCIACGVCAAAAPTCFSQNRSKNYYYVCKQPATPKEREECKQALSACPTASIGQDG